MSSDSAMNLRLLLIVGSAFLPLACGDPAGPDYATLVITTRWVSNAVLNEPYSDTLVAAGGDSVYSWSVTVDSLPTGLILDTSTGIISGTSSVTGSNTFTVQVASGDGQTDTQELTITVARTAILQPNELCSDYQGSAIVTFADANLEAVIRERLSLGAEDSLTCAVVSGLTVIAASSLEITSVLGIQNLTSLTSLHLGANSIRNISPLSGLTSLEEIILHNNSISDISALSGLTSLERLDLQTNLISDISALSGLDSLKHLMLHSNSIGDISPLSGLTSLTELGLVNNSITDISALTGLTNLGYLYLADNSIHDINVLSGLDSLKHLNVDGNSISDISALNGLTNVTGLHLGYNSISDISALSGLTRLASLYLHNNSIGDISALSGLTYLNHLNLGYNSISDISALSGLTRLTWLNLQSNPNLTDIQPLLDNTGLGAGDTVYLWSTNVRCTDVAALEAKGVEVQSDCT